MSPGPNADVRSSPLANLDGDSNALGSWLNSPLWGFEPSRSSFFFLYFPVFSSICLIERAQGAARTAPQRTAFSPPRGMSH